MKKPAINKAIYLIYYLYFTTKGICQPYYYLARNVDAFGNALIDRINLDTGQHEPFIKDAIRMNEMTWNSNQSMLFVYWKGPIMIIDCANPRNRHYLPINQKVENVLHCVSTPANNRLYVEWNSRSDPEEKTSVYHLPDFKLISIETALDLDMMGDFNRDGSVFYCADWDSALNCSVVKALSMETKKVIWKKAVEEIGAVHKDKFISNINKNKVLMSYSALTVP
jgi:hypothetical protein